MTLFWSCVRLATGGLLSLAAAAFAAAGEPLGSNFTISATSGMDAMHPAAAYNRQLAEYLVVWRQDLSATHTIHGRLISRAGQLLGNAIEFDPASSAHVDRDRPDVDFNGWYGEYMVVWEEYSNAAYRIRGQRVLATGAPGAPFTISGNGMAGAARRPAIAFCSASNTYLVVWQNVAATGHSNVVGQVLSRYGGLMGPNFMVRTNAANPDVAYNAGSESFLVVWYEKNPIGHSDAINGALLNSGGGQEKLVDLEDAGTESWHVQGPRVTALPNAGSNGVFFIAWDFWYGTDLRHPRGTMMTGNGSWPYSGTDLCDDSQTENYSPAVAANQQKQEFLVTWTSSTTGLVSAASVLGRASPPQHDAWGGTNTVQTANYAHSAAAGGWGDQFLVISATRNLLGSYTLYGRFWGTPSAVVAPWSLLLLEGQQ